LLATCVCHMTHRYVWHDLFAFATFVTCSHLRRLNVHMNVCIRIYICGHKCRNWLVRTCSNKSCQKLTFLTSHKLRQSQIATFVTSCDIGDLFAFATFVTCSHLRRLRLVGICDICDSFAFAWMRHVNLNESWCIAMSRVTHEWVIHVLIHGLDVNDIVQIWISRVTYEWDMSHMNETCHL